MKKVILTILLCMVFVFSGCFYQNENNSKISLSQVESIDRINNESCYLIEETNENIISIMIPYIQEIDDNNIFLIKDFVSSKIEKICGEAFHLTESKNGIVDKNKNYSNYYIEVSSKVSYISHDLISIVFEGVLNKKGTAHPCHLFFTFNFNSKTYKKVAFSDMYTLDETLYDTFSQQAQKSILEQNDGLWPKGWGNFSEELCSKDKFLNGIVAEDEIYWYHIKNGIGISYPVPYALGDHMEVEIPYESLVKTGDG